MSARRCRPAVMMLLAVVLAAAPRAACGSDAYPLALAAMAGDGRPALLLAQRAVERQWGPSEDSVYVEVDVPEWRSEGWAGAMSAVVPGAGQVYAGEPRGAWYAVAELVGWTAHRLFRSRGHALQDDAARYAGSPTDSTSRWSFSRWSQATQQDPAALVALYEADRPAFYDLIANDSQYLDGWDGEATATRASFAESRRQADDRLRLARYAAAGVWLNHIIAAVDALRLTRSRNLTLRRDLDLRVRGGWRHGTPEVMAVVQRRF